MAQCAPSCRRNQESSTGTETAARTVKFAGSPESRKSGNKSLNFYACLSGILRKQTLSQATDALRQVLSYELHNEEAAEFLEYAQEYLEEESARRRRTIAEVIKRPRPTSPSRIHASVGDDQKGLSLDSTNERLLQWQPKSKPSFYWRFARHRAADTADASAPLRNFSNLATKMR